MAKNKPDIRMLIGAEGGATSGGRLIKQELQRYFKDGLKIKVKLDIVDAGSFKALISNANQATKVSTGVHSKSKAGLKISPKVNSDSAAGVEIFDKVQEKTKTLATTLLSDAIKAGVTSGIKKAITAIYDLDKALTSLQVVNGYSKKDAKELLNSNSQLAQKIGITTAEITNAAIAWQRQGYSAKESNALVENSMALSIAGMMDSTKAAAALSAAMKSYGYSVQSSISVVDMWAAIGAVSSASVADITTAVQQTDTAAKTAGLSLAELSAQAAVLSEATQDGAISVGNTLKTMYSRMSGVQQGNLINPETMEDLSGVEAALKNEGILLRENGAGFRNFGAVLREVSERWGELSAVSKANISNALAGADQYQTLNALMQNYGKVLEYTTVAGNSAGTSMEKLGIHQEGLEAKQNALIAAFENMVGSTIPKEILGFFYELGILTVNAASIFGGLPATIIATIAAFAGLKTTLDIFEESKFGDNLIGTLKSIMGAPRHLSAMGLALSEISKINSTTGESTLELSKAFSNLDAKTILSVASSKNLSKAKLEEAILSSALSDEIKKEVLSKYTNVAATDAQTASNIPATASTFSLKAAVDGLAFSFKALSAASKVLLVITAAIAVFQAIKWVVDKATVSLEEQRQKIEDLSKEVSAATSSFSAIETELEDVARRIAEINALPVLSAADDSELEYLQSTNAELETRLFLLKQERDIKKEELNAAIKGNYETDMLDDSEFRSIYEKRKVVVQGAEGYIPASLTEEGYTKEAIQRVGEINQEIEDNIRLTNELNRKKAKGVALTEDETQQYDTLTNKYGSLKEEHTSLSKKLVDIGIKYSNWIKDYSADDEFRQGMVGMTEDIYKALNPEEWFERTKAANAALVSEYQSAIDGGDSEIITETYKAVEEGASKAGMSVDDFIARYKAQVTDVESGYVAISDALKQAKAAKDAYNSVKSDIDDGGNISLDTLESVLSTYSDLNDIIVQYNQGSATELDILDALEKKYNDAASAAFYYKSIVDSLAPSTTDTIDSVQSSLKTLQSAQDEYSEHGKISIDTLQELANLGPEYLKYLIDENGQISLNSAAISILAGENMAYLKTLAAEQVASYATSLAKGKLEEKTKKASLATADSKKDVEKSTDALIRYSAAALVGAAKTKDLADALSGDFKGFSTVEWEEINNKVSEYGANLTNTINAVGSGIGSWAGFKSSSSKTPAEEYIVEIDKFRDAIKNVDDLAKEIDTTKAKLALVDKNDIKSIEAYNAQLTSLYEQQQDALHTLNNERDSEIQNGVDKLRSIGFSVEYDHESNNLYIENLEHLNKLGSELSAEGQKKYRTEIEALIKSLIELNKSNVDGSLEWWRLEKLISELLDENQSRQLDALQKQKDGLSNLVDLTKDLIKHEQNDMIDALEDQTDKFKEIIDLKKRSLQLSKEEEAYSKSVDSKNTEIGKLQSRIDALSMDDSRSAQAQKASLLEELAKKQKELADIQSDYSIGKQEEALDAEADMFEKSQDDKIAEINKFLANNQALTKAAMDRIDQQGDALFDDLLKYALHYTDTTESELVSMWATAKSAMEEYGSAAQAMSLLDARLDIGNNGTGASSANRNAIVSQMKTNSEAWWNADANRRNDLSKQNQDLFSELNRSLDGDKVTYDQSTGTYWYQGKKLYEHVFHQGEKSAGRHPTPKQNELWALIEKGEAVLTEKQQTGLLGLMKGFAGRLSISGLGSTIPASMQNVKSSTATQVIVDASIQIDGATNLSDAMLSIIKKYPDAVANAVSKKLLKA